MPEQKNQETRDEEIAIEPSSPPRRRSCAHQNPHRRVVSTEHEHLHYCTCGEVVARFCRHVDTTPYDGNDFDHLDLGGEPVVRCDRCGDVLWSHDRHRLLVDLGDPHAISCEDCGVTIGIRQLPPGLPNSAPHGHICGDCTEGRRHAEERREELDTTVSSSA